MDPRTSLRHAFPDRAPEASLRDDVDWYELTDDEQRRALPTVLLAHAAWASDERDDTPMWFGMVAHQLTPTGDDDDLRPHRRRALAWLTAAQRRAIAAFAAHHLPVAADAWQRAAEADADWFEAWWPDRPRPTAVAVAGALRSAFPSLVLADESLQHVAPADFPAHLAAACLAVCEGDAARIDDIDRALRPDLRQGRREVVEARWAGFTPAMRRAVASFLQAYSGSVAARRSWQHAAAAPDDDWLRHVQLEPVADAG